VTQERVDAQVVAPGRLWVNGRLVDETAPVVRADDHGLVVGDGVFETCAVHDGVPFALTRHLRRLRESAAGLGIAIDEDLIRTGIAEVLAGVPARARLRVTVTGGPSPYGSDRGDAAPTVLVATGALAPWPPTTDVAMVPWTRNERSATAGLKTTSYADNVVALRWAHERGAAEALFANSRDEICEGTGSNIFFEYAGGLVTPPLSSGCLGGITRELLVEWLRAAGADVEERSLTVDALRTATEAFITSTTRVVQPIRALDGVAYGGAPGPLTRRASEVFARYAADNVDP
jgi:branched-chain amino acid aminotransferase